MALWKEGALSDRPQPWANFQMDGGPGKRHPPTETEPGAQPGRAAQPPASQPQALSKALHPVKAQGSAQGLSRAQLRMTEASEGPRSPSTPDRPFLLGGRGLSSQISPARARYAGCPLASTSAFAFHSNTEQSELGLPHQGGGEAVRSDSLSPAA